MSSSEWNNYLLGDICALGDGAHTKVKRLETGIPYLTSKNIKNGYIHLNNVDYISEEDYCRLFGESQKSVRHLQEDDVLVGIIGTLGNCYLYKKNDKFGISSSIGIIRPDKEVLDPKYLYYIVNSKRFLSLIQNFKGGSVQAYTNLPTLRNVPVKLPNIKTQKFIANILSTLDEKIETNNQVNKKLEEMAQAIFKQWFVDFEFPNEDGEPYKSSGGEMIESEMGMIPKGWEQRRIEELGEVIGGGTPSTKNEEYYGGNIPWITPKDLSGYNRKFIRTGERGITEIGLKNSSAKLMPKYSVLFSSRAPIGYITIAANTVSTNQGFKSIVCKEEIISHNYMYYFLKYNKEVIENLASGSTFKEVSGTVMKKVKVCIPDKKVLVKFNKIDISIDNQLMKNYDEIDNLVMIRDSLLPKLMSGEIRVTLDN